MAYADNPERYIHVTAHMATEGADVGSDNPLPTVQAPAASLTIVDVTVNHTTYTTLADTPCAEVTLINQTGGGSKMLWRRVGETTGPIQLFDGRVAKLRIPNTNGIQVKSDTGAGNLVLSLIITT